MDTFNDVVDRVAAEVKANWPPVGPGDQAKDELVKDLLETVAAVYKGEFTRVDLNSCVSSLCRYSQVVGGVL